MAGEVTKTTALIARDAGTLRAARGAKGVVHFGSDKFVVPAATSLELADKLITDIRIPSNAIVLTVSVYNADLDTGTTLTLDFGVAAAADHTTITSGTATKRLKDDIISAALFVSASTVGQAATTAFTTLNSNVTPANYGKMVWELLGYDADPRTDYNIVMNCSAAATGVSGTPAINIRVSYLGD